MNPPPLHNPMAATNVAPSVDLGFGVDVLQDHVCELTFDEQRELPMRMQLGLDLTALD